MTKRAYQKRNQEHVANIHINVHCSCHVTKYYPITFIGSIIWIAIYSYLMVWWTTIVGDAVGIPSVVSE